MSARWAKPIIAATVVAALCAVAHGDRLVVAGDEQALWLLRGDGNQFDLAARPTGGSWQWVAQGRSGLVAAAAARGATLHVAFTSGQCHLFDLLSREDSPAPSLPSPPLAMCDGTELDEGSGMVAIVPAFGATQPTTETTEAPGATVEVLALTRGRWRSVATAAGLVGNLEHLRAAAWRGALYLLVPPADDKPNRLIAWDGREWRDVPLPPGMAAGSVLAMASLDGSLAAVVANPAERTGALRLSVATMDAPGGEFALQAITADGKDVTWTHEDSVSVSVLSDKLAVVWGPAQQPKLATVGLATARLDPIEDVAIFTTPLQDTRAEQIREFFLWGLLVLILVPLFVLRPTGVPKPFSLPPPLMPAAHARRLIAALVDLLPFLFAASLYLDWALPMPSDEATRMLVEMLKGQRPVPVEAAYAWLGTTVAYLLYGILLEMRFGTTVGKWLFKLRVVGDEGARPRPLEVLLRNLFKSVEIFYFFPLLIAVVITRYRQRLGDMAARTAVIDARIVVPPPTTPPADSEDPADESLPPEE